MSVQKEIIADSEDFEQYTPPLSVAIKGILGRYPDGQIFKEMIQNADDAGAKTVWFYVDKRQHGSSNLPCPELARFQGPALVAANDACFTNEDWKGIRRLQQSIKADDPLKVGRFGIGFNSVYHLTDLPIIVSGNRLACFEPQMKIWKHTTGKSFNLTSLISQQSDIIVPLCGLAGFDPSIVSTNAQYPHTIFRFPLRTEPGLLDDRYTVQMLQQLLDGLREEAKYLLLFLKSVDKIEVQQVSETGEFSLSFCIEVDQAHKAAFTARRETFMQELKYAHSLQPYMFSNVISFTARFSVTATYHNPGSIGTQTSTTNWLITNSVGSVEVSVQEAAKKQYTLPWVGAALELGASTESGRIFCFLPMPTDTSCGLPIHVHGTFGLNDDRRSLKWPGKEMQNDQTSNWNKILVSKLLPPCYKMLLLEAKKHLSQQEFYSAWPETNNVKKTHFSEILEPLFVSLFSQAVLRTDVTGDWIPISQATFISEGGKIRREVSQALSDCAVQLVTIPPIIWAAITYIYNDSTAKVTSKLARGKLRLYPQSYTGIDANSKVVLLQYCLYGRCSDDLSGLHILPLANDTFTSFDNTGTSGAQMVYLCTSDCPRALLPHLDHLLVDVVDPDLQKSLSEVARSCQTKLRMLTEKEIATLLPQAMPSSWLGKGVVSIPDTQLPPKWLEIFWIWLQQKNLYLFHTQLIIPIYQSTSHSSHNFYLTKPDTKELVYISKHAACSKTLLSGLFKMNVMVCQQSEFSYVQHSQLAEYTKQFDINGVLDAIASQLTYSNAVFTSEEAESLRIFLASKSGSYSSSKKRNAVLQNMAIFTSTSSNQLYSVSNATSCEPSNCAINLSNLPSNLILLSRSNYHQLQLLQMLQVSFLTDVRLLTDHVFPLIKDHSLSSQLSERIMSDVLDVFEVLNLRDKSFSTAIQRLPFIKTTSGWQSPQELFDPSNKEIEALYKGMDVFPHSPYDRPQRLQVLRKCHLQCLVTPQQVLDIVYSISVAPSSQPQMVDSNKNSRAKAILNYISTAQFQQQISGTSNYSVANSRNRYTFANALYILSKHQSWLPVMNIKPTGYPDQLSWKGSSYSSHFVSLTDSVVVLDHSVSHSLPFQIGTQMYIVTPHVHSNIAAMLPTDQSLLAQCVVANFIEVLNCKDQLPVSVIDSLMDKIYPYLDKIDSSYLKQVYSTQEWIHIKRENRFVGSAVVALQQNSTFRHNLEPYVYTLPYSLSQYTNLFSPVSKVSRAISRSQILSVLKTIKQQAQPSVQRTSAQEAWSTVMSILNWLTDNGNTEVTDATNVYVPVESNSDWPQLLEASKVVYTDNDFLKSYLQSSNLESSYTFVHARINSRLAHSLGVIPLSEFLDISEDTFEDAGQHEPLTVRLKNILREYKDGMTIIKELLQNADDAQATEVNICYDARQHEINPNKLFFSGMAEAHGPALVVHNNKTFSDDDFTNITKLAGATKQDKALKIGKFGVGFCSVYHMTDVPSFISRENLYIFDPTLTYLRKEIKNPAQPGKRIAFNHKFISGSEQLCPYDGLFGFDRSKSYEGTMFRLPFRTSASELSGTCYTEATVQELIAAIKKCSSDILLFLQHVRSITFQRIDTGQHVPTVLLKVTRETIPLTVGNEIRRLSCTDLTYDAHSLHHKTCLTTQWLVSQTCGLDVQGKHYTASVACPIGKSPAYKLNPTIQGEVFCFLPLSQKTGLPVHISSNFAVINNRRGIWTSDEATSKADTEVRWNMFLMESVIPEAYHALLNVLKEMKKNGHLKGYVFHCLWPDTINLLQQNPWRHMVAQLYKLISSDQLFYSLYQNQWLFLSEIKIVQAGILCQSSEKQSTPASVLQIVQHLKLLIVDLPSIFHTYFNLQGVIIDESAFTKLFFNNLQSLKVIVQVRSEVIQQMLEVYASEYDNGTVRCYKLESYFKQYPCIPCTPEGIILRKCDEVVDPFVTFAKLFNSADSRFPIDDLAHRHLSLTALHDLGMISKEIPINMLVERAQTVPALFKVDKKKALNRASLILSTNIKIRERTRGEGPMLSSVPFLPVLQKPTGYHLSWKGEGYELKCGKDLMRMDSGDFFSASRTYIDVAGSQVAFVNESKVEEGGCGHIAHEKIRLLEVRTSPTCEEAIKQLKELIETFESKPVTEKLVTRTDRCCRCIYGYLDRKLDHETKAIQEQRKSPTNYLAQIQQLQHIPCVWTGKQFVKVDVIAEEWSIQGPYLYRLPQSLSSRSKLIKALNIKAKFSLKDIEKVLQKMKDDFGDQPVDDACQTILMALVPLLHNIDSESIKTCTIMLPDENFVLHRSPDLAFNDVEWAPKDPKYNYVNSVIPTTLAKQLHVKPVRSKILERYNTSSKTHFRGVDFGQREELTRRIQNILRDYPFDITILKELLQNADDAKATKMYIILDKRTHGKQGILSENWESLQGPSLLVWNDSTFTERDLQGIQNLGLGSKRSDSESIGQYGIGFNVVYHLTDCPSFITGGETMCIFDPHCKYVDEANELKPGRRFDNLSQGFWDNFPDMKSAYLQGGIDNCNREVTGGSLFRFPLRHTAEHIKTSRIVQTDRHGLLATEPLTAEMMSAYLSEWAPRMKEAMLFLNHITELRFYVIEKNSKTLLIQNHYQSQVDPMAQQCRVQLHEKLSAFKQLRGNKSFVIRYPLIISDVHWGCDGKKSTTDESWLIQQGVGDLENEQQTWGFIDTVKPRHGIAAPIQLPPKPQVHLGTLNLFNETDKFSGKVFCFLPLPIDSNLPVHINGHFILNSNRRNLWSSTESNREDDRSTWNNRMFEAIASSYANLLERAQPFFVKSVLHMSSHSAKDELHRYYEIFPDTVSLDKQYKTFVEMVYIKLMDANPNILAVIKPIHKAKQDFYFHVEWHPPKSSSPSTQVYFWKTSYTLSYYTPRPADDEEKKLIKPMLEKIGMNLTAAPSRIQDHLNKAVKEAKDSLQHTTPQTVYSYYTKFCSQTTATGKFPCELSKTVFKEVNTFKSFTQYLLKRLPLYNPIAYKRTTTTPFTATFTFPEEPFGHPLLLTADNQLRRFQKHTKVLYSTFSQLFPQCPNKFLHPEMLGNAYSREYFVQCVDSEYGLQQVNEILTKHLPHQLRTTRLDLYPQNMTKQHLVEYWKCLSNDPIFSHHKEEILKEWALLPASTGSLYVYSDNLVPVRPPIMRKENAGVDLDPLFGQVYQLLIKIGMPFLDTTIVGETSLTCPSLSAYDQILKALFYLNKEKDLSTILTKEMVDIVINYLSKINFRSDPTSLKYVKSLPLFACVDNKFTSLQKKEVYVWPDDACDIAYTKWRCDYPNVVFVQANSSWTFLGSAVDLGIKELTAEEVYYTYIFEKFAALTEDERYNHLTHIKDNMFNSNMVYKNGKSRNERKTRATDFINGLENLSCISGNDGTLQPIKNYCNHTLEMFMTFKEHFQFLPNYFRSSPHTWSDWSDFFIQIGLRQTVSKPEYLQFCRETADGYHGDLEQASGTLLQYLISESTKDANWLSDQHFVQQVSAIAFVPTKPLPELAWIRQVATPTESLSIGDHSLTLTQLSKAAVLETSVQLWTVKPVIDLNGFVPFNSHHREWIVNLGITYEAQVKDVIQNIRNVCALDRWTNFNHFDQYPDTRKPLNQSKTMMEVMVSQFHFLQSKQHELTTGDKSILRSLPCIPVYSTSDATYKSQIVLVKPHCVLTCDVTGFHPFLYRLDHCLTPMISLLQEIGVESSIDLSHLQFALERAYQCSAGEVLETTTKLCVLKALRTLQMLLAPGQSRAVNSTTEMVSEVLSPLYLPTSENKLALSTSLLYVDDNSFEGRIKTQLDGYPLIQTKHLEQGIPIYECHFCNMLPKVVRPKGLSEMFTLTVLPQCKETNDTDVGRSLKETFGMTTILPKAFAACVHHCTEDNSSLEELEARARTFFSTTDIVTLDPLCTAIIFKESGKKLGEMFTKFVMKVFNADESFPEGQSRRLYLASKQGKKRHYSLVIRDLCERLLTVVKLHRPIITNEHLQQLGRILTPLLEAQTPEDVCDILEDEHIPLEGGMDKVTLKLGREVPDIWHHRLDQTIENVFHPGEIVGYEEMEGLIILSQIMHPILPHGVDSFESVSRISLKYNILTSPDDEDGTEVSVLNLYKFLKGPKSASKEPIQLRKGFEEENLSEIKQNVASQLDEIWKLPKSERSTAIRRLLLKWHPDESHDNPVVAGEVFKMIDSEIEKRKEHVNHGHLNVTARRLMESSNLERHSYNDSSQASVHGLAGVTLFDNLRPINKPEEGKRWLKQAEANFETLEWLFLGSLHTPNLCADVCFMAHQVAEKALKAGKYFVCGLEDKSLKSHNLITHACGLQGEKPDETLGLVSHTSQLEDYYLDPRYPNRWSLPTVPANKYGHEDADKAKQHAEAILNIIQAIIKPE